MHGVRSERAPAEAPSAKPDHLFLAVDDFEGEILANVHHNHVERVRTDVDGGQTHGVPGGRGLAFGEPFDIIGRILPPLYHARFTARLRLAPRASPALYTY